MDFYSYMTFLDGPGHDSAVLQSDLITTFESGFYQSDINVYPDPYALVYPDETDQHRSSPSPVASEASVPPKTRSAPRYDGASSSNVSRSGTEDTGGSQVLTQKERRRLMNRISQRAYRARKDAQVAQYQDKIAQLEGEVEELAQQRVSLMALNEYLIRQNRQLTMRRESP
ncbi:hypothetical protein BJX68DRAFT_249721 [Aspergillus pseudodeflectus]|uniref:BZIP domain-containing protein n=1 Tax=Aspergillus pseudodeflectus TaxID=176178 RepID=A0ABR4JCH0_9EURO